MSRPGLHCSCITCRGTEMFIRGTVSRNIWHVLLATVQRRTCLWNRALIASLRNIVLQRNTLYIWCIHTHTHTQYNCTFNFRLVEVICRWHGQWLSYEGKIFLCYLPLHDLTGVFMAFGLPFMFQHSWSGWVMFNIVQGILGLSAANAPYTPTIPPFALLIFVTLWGAQHCPEISQL